MIGILFTAFHRTFYGLGQRIADACDPGEIAPVQTPPQAVSVKPYTRKRPLADKKAATHARLRDELGWAS